MFRLICPACTAPSLSPDDQAILICPYCGTRIVSDAPVCAACGRTNTPEAELCLDCGEPLTMTARVVQRQGTVGREPFFLQRARGMASGLKERGDVASRERLDRFREIDRSREMRQAEEVARRARRDRKLLVASAAALGVLSFAILIGLLIVLFR